jgi:hypothetical protein
MVCEGSFRRKTERQKTCTDVRCKAELRRFPLAYSWPEKHEEGKPPSDTSKAPGSAHFTGLKTGIRPTHKCLREWVWSPETDLELELHDGKAICWHGWSITAAAIGGMPHYRAVVESAFL